ncbi:Transposase, IS30 family (plasmid) [Piscirickettsia salmonis]|nr:hypothetical protein [Piscirickettsia salmonis]QGO66914.1 Transposase, IS30 family [Piscirickettsia salmonis]QGO68432.1 Transposase, IS30 family [Piscirickettsia salmonis]
MKDKKQYKRYSTAFKEVSDKEIAKIEHTLNTRRRASLNYRSPNHVFLEYLMAA